MPELEIMHLNGNGLISQNFAHKKTGEVVTEVPMLEIGDYEQYHGPACYYSPAQNVVIDAVRPETGLTYYGKKDRAAILEEHPDAVLLTIDEAGRRHEAPFVEPVEEITKEKYWYWLEVLFPEDWQHTSGGESFKLCERACGSITKICAQIGDRYFSMSDKYTTPHKEILQRCRDYMADQTTETAPAEGTDPHTDASIQGL